MSTIGLGDPALEERLRAGLAECGNDPYRLRAFAARQLDERLAEQARADALERELTALGGAPTGAPDYPGHWWSAEHGWSGPHHLVPYATVPYPGFGPDVKPGSLPDIQTPGPKALCGAPYRGQAHRWPRCEDVCAECARRAAALREVAALPDHLEREREILRSCGRV